MEQDIKDINEMHAFLCIARPTIRPSPNHHYQCDIL